ncbi:hypothetical protein E2651_10095 [Streptomyces sp. MZ04]|nr:hypothetical protein E2651_10095 [Streptomyces sp. MZ04]
MPCGRPSRTGRRRVRGGGRRPAGRRRHGVPPTRRRGRGRGGRSCPRGRGGAPGRDTRGQLEERTEELEAARAANRELTRALNHSPPEPR